MNVNVDMEDLFPFYALGALTDEERAQVEAYVAADPAARARLQAMIEALSLLPLATAPVAPPPEVKHSLMARVRADAFERAQPLAQPTSSSLAAFLSKLRLGRQRPSNTWRLALPAVAVLSLVVALAATLWAFSLRQQVAGQQARVVLLEEQIATLENSATSLEAELASLETENGVLQRELQAREEILALLTTPAAETITIAGTEHQPGARGRLVMDPNMQSAVFVASGLKPLDEGRVYQLWLIHGAQPMAAGTFHADNEGQGTLVVPAGAAALPFDTIGVSIEPAGGSEQPTGDIVLLGTTSS